MPHLLTYWRENHKKDIFYLSLVIMANTCHLKCIRRVIKSTLAAEILAIADLVEATILYRKFIQLGLEDEIRNVLIIY